MTASRKNMVATVSPSPYPNPLLLDLVSPPPHRFFLGVAFAGVFLVGKGGAGAPYSYTILSGTGTPPEPAPGITLDGVTGELQGAPTTQGTYSFVAQVQDAASNVFPHAFTIFVESGLFVVTGRPTPGEQDIAYRFQFIVRDAMGVTITSGFTVSSGSEPDGLTLHTNGIMDGTPTALAVGITYFTVNVNTGSASLDIPCSIAIYSLLQFAATDIPDIIRGQDYLASYPASGGLPPYRWSYGPVAAGLDGIVMDGATGLVTGNTTSPSGTYSGGFTISDALGGSITQSTAWIVQDANRHIQPQANTVDIGSPNPKNLNFIDGTNTTATVTNDGETVTIQIDASGTAYTPPVTTKGDLFGFSTVPARVPVGANGEVLTADSAQALGVKWAAASAVTVTRGPGVALDGAGLPLTGTYTRQVEVPYAFAGTGWTSVGDVSGSGSIVVKHSTYAAFPTMTTLFTATITTAQKAQATGLSFSLAAGDILQFVCSGFANFTTLQLTLDGTGN